MIFSHWLADTTFRIVLHVMNKSEVSAVYPVIAIPAINRIMKERAGMGESGESYLIGQDLLMRSDSFLDPDNHSVNASFKNPSKLLA